MTTRSQFLSLTAVQELPAKDGIDMITAEMIAEAFTEQFNDADCVRRYFDGDDLANSSIDGYFDLHEIARHLNAANPAVKSDSPAPEAVR